MRNLWILNCDCSYIICDEAYRTKYGITQNLNSSNPSSSDAWRQVGMHGAYFVPNFFAFFMRQQFHLHFQSIIQSDNIRLVHLTNSGFSNRKQIVRILASFLSMLDSVCALCMCIQIFDGFLKICSVDLPVHLLYKLLVILLLKMYLSLPYILFSVWHKCPQSPQSINLIKLYIKTIEMGKGKDLGKLSWKLFMWLHSLSMNEKVRGAEKIPKSPAKKTILFLLTAPVKNSTTI